MALMPVSAPLLLLVEALLPTLMVSASSSASIRVLMLMELILKTSLPAPPLITNSSLLPCPEIETLPVVPGSPQVAEVVSTLVVLMGAGESVSRWTVEGASTLLAVTSTRSAESDWIKMTLSSRWLPPSSKLISMLPTTFRTLSSRITVSAPSAGTMSSDSNPHAEALVGVPDEIFRLEPWPAN